MKDHETLYTHNCLNPNSTYHLAALRGWTVCRRLVPLTTITGKKPPDKRLCRLCAKAVARREADASIPWEEMG